MQSIVTSIVALLFVILLGGYLFTDLPDRLGLADAPTELADRHDHSDGDGHDHDAHNHADHEGHSDTVPSLPPFMLDETAVAENHVLDESDPHDHGSHSGHKHSVENSITLSAQARKNLKLVVAPVKVCASYSFL